MNNTINTMPDFLIKHAKRLREERIHAQKMEERKKLEAIRNLILEWREVASELSKEKWSVTAIAESNSLFKSANELEKVLLILEVQ